MDDPHSVALQLLTPSTAGRTTSGWLEKLFVRLSGYRRVVRSEHCEAAVIRRFARSKP
jgi:hypothetical protein